MIKIDGQVKVVDIIKVNIIGVVQFARTAKLRKACAPACDVHVPARVDIRQPSRTGV
jgi:hypothetical protein